ncbi:uncharacterized protein LOC128990084 isoform X1 [Macrosteles quadrilineatus]|uniref:uncharacterized protein LOC128990084 isoform X1 n=1 Tax=Macrosteles quadrilineatus TaxID=74068 RepID=UPI0023E1B5C9|nr:uncharacterized protein LOC128990084 isoform X1 [Macrosteles quadrilineatus]
MPTSLSWLLLPAAVSLAMAQDGYNLYKDIQRGKVDELERFITDENYQIDHTALTWPSAGARLQNPNSAKRTMNKFKNFKLQKPVGDEDSEEEESTFSGSEEGEDDQSSSRILIPRTHGMLRGNPFEQKRGFLWKGQMASSAASAKEVLNRDIFLVRAGKYLSIAAAKPFLLSLEKCKILRSDFREYYQCG